MHINHGKSRRLRSILIADCGLFLYVHVQYFYWSFNDCIFDFISYTFDSLISGTYIYNWYFHNHLVQLFVLSSKAQKKIWIDNLKNVKYVVPHVSTTVILKRHCVLVASNFTSDPLRRWGRKFYKSYFILTPDKVYNLSFFSYLRHQLKINLHICFFFRFYRSNSFSYPCNCDAKCKNVPNCSCSEGSRNHCKHCRYVKCSNHV